MAIEPMLCCIEQLSERIKQYDRMIAKMADDYGEAGANGSMAELLDRCRSATEP